jgi:hypothetical protein
MAFCTARLMRLARTSFGGLGVLGVGGCLGYQPPPASAASPRTLSCVIAELGRMDYSITMSRDGSWYQAFRSRGAGADQLWLRLATDSRRPPWLELRATSWEQSPPSGPPTSPTEFTMVPPTATQAQEDARTALIRCSGSSSYDGAT